MAIPSLSILIPTCNRRDMLSSCVQSLLKQVTRLDYEIILLNQSDRAEQPQLITDNPRVRNVPCNFKNKSRALNLGVQLSMSDLIAVIDDDCIAQEYWIERLHDELTRNTKMIVTGRVIAGEVEDGAVRSRLHDEMTDYITYRKEIITPIFILSGCNFGFSKKTYKAVGPFNEHFGPGSHFRSSDDNEWSYRALNRGVEILYSPRVVVYHRSWRDKEADRKLMETYGYAAGAFFRLIYDISKLDFIRHGFNLLFWLIKKILLTPSSQEAKNHFFYAANFISGFNQFHSHASSRKAH